MGRSSSSLSGSCSIMDINLNIVNSSTPFVDFLSAMFFKTYLHFLFLGLENIHIFQVL